MSDKKRIIPVNPANSTRVPLSFLDNFPARIHPTAIPVATVAITTPVAEEEIPMVCLQCITKFI